MYFSDGGQRFDRRIRSNDEKIIGYIDVGGARLLDK